jgi:hypothetical protein
MTPGDRLNDMLRKVAEHNRAAAEHHRAVAELIPTIRDECARRELISSPRPAMRFNTRDQTITSAGIEVRLPALPFDLFRRVWETKNKFLTELRAERLVWGVETTSRSMAKTVRRTDKILEEAKFPYSISMAGGKIRILLMAETICDRMRQE